MGYYVSDKDDKLKVRSRYFDSREDADRAAEFYEGIVQEVSDKRAYARIVNRGNINIQHEPTRNRWFTR